MSPGTEKILIKALSLLSEARAYLAEKLIESLEDEPNAELSPAWQAEVSKALESD